MNIHHTFLAIVVTVIWGANFTIIVFGLESLPPILFTAIRFWLVAIPGIFFFKRPAFNTVFLLYAAGTFVVQFALLFSAMQIGASAGLSSLLLQIQVFFTMIFAALFIGERIVKFQVIGLAIACIGLLVIIAHLGGDMPLLAFVLIVFAAAGWGCGNVASTQIKNTNVFSLLVWGSLLAAIPLTGMSLLIEFDAWTVQTFTAISARSAFAVFYVSVLATLVGYGIWAYLLQHNRASDVAQFTLLVPIFGMLASASILGETLTWWKILAGILIVAGLIVSRINVASSTS